MKRGIRQLAAGALALAPQLAAAETCAGIGMAQFFDRMDYCVSSVLRGQSGNAYGPDNLMDGDDSTAWCEGWPGTTGADLTLRLRGSAGFQRLVISNGYAKSRTSFLRNARPRTIELRTDTGLRFQTQLPDHIQETVVMLPQPAQNEVTIRIVDVYPGTHYQDTCLNNLYIDFEWEEMQLQDRSGKKN